MDLRQKLEILADAAKYDASCASSGTDKRDSRSGRGLGSTGPVGICHAYAPDGRCISLLKILLTNACQFDCLYCVNRASSNVRRARFTVDEIVRLTLGFYERNYIEGLFLSSGIIRSADYTMSEIIRVARALRDVHDFRGYIHLKTIPGADESLIAEAGRFADRLSVNIELPGPESLGRFAPQKDLSSIRRAMAALKFRIDAARAEPRGPRFAPAGQSTQMIVGVDGTDDRAILSASAGLYAGYGLRRVYYSAFSPIPGASPNLPSRPAPLLREHRLYQADWLMRFYGFDWREIVGASGMLPLDLDPKLAWALANRGRFPVDVNRAEREMLLRVPGLGIRNVDRLLHLRRLRRIHWDDLRRLGVRLAKTAPFLVAADHRPRDLDARDLAARLSQAGRQLSLFRQ